MKFRADIQGLRAIAVILVFIFHLVPSFMSGGFIGVDVFFVISGYLITGIILHKKESKNFSFKEFYISRIKRIVPSYYVILILILLISAFIYIPTDISKIREGSLWSTLFLSNTYLSNLDNYFGASSIENPILHTWTLSIEMQFYFLLPIILVFLPRKLLSTILIIICILIFSFSFYNSTFLDQKNFMYFSLLARIPEFLIGSLFAINSDVISKIRGKSLGLISIVSIILLFIFSFLLSESSNFPGLWVLIPCIATGILIAAEKTWLNKLLLSNKILVHLGELSYAIYLIHWPIMAFVRYYFGKTNFSFIEMFFITIITYLISLFLFKTVEVSFRKLKNKEFIIGFGVILFCLGSIAIALPLLNKNSNIPDHYSKPTFAVNSHGAAFKEIGYYGDLSVKNDSILVLGDSHAQVYAGILNHIGKKNSFNFKFISNSSYPLIPNISKSDFTDENDYKTYSSLLKYADTEQKKAKVIIIASLWYDSINSLPHALDTFLQSLDSSKKVIVLQDYPMLDKNPIRVNKGFVKNSKFSNKYNVEEKAIPKDISAILKKYKNVYVININYLKYFDDLPFYNDTLMYYDEGHFNNYGTSKVAERIHKDFMKQFDDILNNKN